MKSKRTIKNKKKYNKNKRINKKIKNKKNKRKKTSKKGGAKTEYEPKCEHALTILTIENEPLHKKIIEKMNSEDKNTNVFTEYTEQISGDYKQRNKKNANYYNERLLRSFFDCFSKKNKNFNFINGYFKEI